MFFRWNLSKYSAFIWITLLHCKLTFLLSFCFWFTSFSKWFFFTHLSFRWKWFSFFFEFLLLNLICFYFLRTKTLGIRIIFLFFFKIRWDCPLSASSFHLCFQFFCMNSFPIITFFKKPTQFGNMSLTFWINILVHFRFDVCYSSVQIIPTFFIIVRIIRPTAWWVTTYVEYSFEPVRYFIYSTFFWMCLFLFITFNRFSCWFFLNYSFLFLFPIYYCSFGDFVWKLGIIATTFFRFLKQIIIQVFIILELCGIFLLLPRFQQSKTPDLILRVVSCDCQILHCGFLVIKYFIVKLFSRRFLFYFLLLLDWGFIFHYLLFRLIIFTNCIKSISFWSGQWHFTFYFFD